MATRNLPQARSISKQGLLSLGSFRLRLPLILLIISVLAALLLAYNQRPFVSVDIGSRDDYVYIDGFHAREFSSTEPSQSFAWPAGSDTLELQQALNPAFHMVTITLDDFRPSTQFPRRLIDVSANGQQLTTLDDRGGKREFRVLLPDAVSAPGLKLNVKSIPDKIAETPPVQALNAVFSGARTYRWSDGQGRLFFPAIGHGPLRLDLQTAVFHPDNQPVNAKLYANGHYIADLPEYRDARQLSVLLSEQVLSSGDLSLELRSDVFTDPRPLGMLVDRIALSPADMAVGQRGMLPPWSALAYGMLIALAAYASLRMLRVPAWWAFILLGIVLAVGAWALARYRAPMGLYLQPLALLIVVSALLTILSGQLTQWRFGTLCVEVDPW